MAKPIEFMLRELDSGRTYGDINDQLAEVVGAVIEHRKKGELTLKLTFSPNGENNVFADVSIKAVAPTKARARTLFYVTAGGDLVRNDPDSPELPLRSVPKEEAKSIVSPGTEERRLA